MCGIAGFFGKKEISKDHIKKCLSLMKKRGPDAEGEFITLDHFSNNVVLLHTRLKIVDIDNRSNQPIVSNKSVMVYNGEVYNYKELIKQEKLKTKSDTEVLFHILNSGGVSGLEKCEGMWAFAFYDKKEGHLFLGRDRFGEKPLYIYETKDGLYFGSEVKFIISLLGYTPRINFNQINRFLVNGYRSLNKKQETFFEGVYQVNNASVMKISQKLQKTNITYWIPKYNPDNKIKSYQDAVVKVREALVRAFGLRLNADVPLAFALSGGVDSTSVVSVAKKIFNYDVHAFTVINKDKRYDESANVSCTVNELKIKCTEIELNHRGFIDELRVMIEQHDSPINFVAYYSHWLLLKEVKQNGYKVLLSGTAADEIFAGYYEHHVNYLADMYRADKDKYAYAVSRWKENTFPIIRSSVWKNERLYIDNPSFRDHLFPDREEFKKYLKYDWNEEFSEEHFCSSFLRNRTYNETFFETTPGIMKTDDLNAMFFSIENRSPFLDRNLFELLYSIPIEYLMRGGIGKSLLRDAMKGIAPDQVMQDPEKKGFNAPIHDLLNVHDEKVVSYLLDDSVVFDYINKPMISDFLKKTNLSTVESKFLWGFVNIKIFLEEYL